MAFGFGDIAPGLAIGTLTGTGYIPTSRESSFTPGSAGADWLFQGDSTDPFGDKATADAQMAAAERAQQAMLEYLGNAQQEAYARGDQAANLIGQGMYDAMGNLTDYGRQALTQLGQGQGLARDQLAHGFATAENALSRYGDPAIQGMQGLAGLGLSYLPGATQQLQTGQNMRGLMGDAAALQQAAGAPVNIYEDPSYRMRVAAGENAINKAASAHGGRLSGRTLKDLANFNQGAASQEYANAFGRQQARIGQQAGLLGQRMGAAGQMDASQLQAGLAAQQNMMGLAGMGFGAGQMANQMQMNRAGQIADLRSGLGQAQAGNTAAFNMAQAQGLQSLGQGLAGTQMQGSTAMGNALMGMGNNDQAAMMQALGMTLPYAGGASAAQGNTMKNIASIAAMVYGASDRNAKTGIREAGDDLGKFLDSLKAYSYEYRDEKHGKGRRFGIMAQDAETTRIGADMVVSIDEVKHIDMTKAVSALLAVAARQHAEIAELKNIVAELRGEG